MITSVVVISVALAAFFIGRLTRLHSLRDERDYFNSKTAELVDALGKAAETGKQARALYAQAEAALERASAPRARAPWSEVSGADSKALAAYVSEMPQQDALVFLALAHPEQAARVLERLDHARAAELLTALVDFEGAPVAEVERIEEGLRSRFLAPEREMWRFAGGPRRAAALLNAMEAGKEAAVMSGIEAAPDTAKQIRRQMFTFEDMTRLDSAGVQLLLRHIEKDKLVLALKGASDRVKALFFDNMSERAQRMLREDMGNVGVVRLRDVDAAQVSIVEMAKELANSGQIVLDRCGDEDELIY